MTESRNNAGRVGFLAPSGGLFIAFAGISGVTATSMAAFASHGLDPATHAHQIELIRSGVQMDYVHLLAMLGVAALAAMGRLQRTWAVAAQWLFLAGGMLFAGNLYLLGLGAPSWVGGTVPVGGIAYILGWVALTVAALLKYRR
ncbi:MAG TPA: DUF423 domain-containing protein [Alphaproteobacteria bacterium]|jgi:uncharacterized membrane protein YgdD (TMEM256/DUF423 family)|nr:DUF423 domain-containing protein [Alphaproteobacteria bacterium]